MAHAVRSGRDLAEVARSFGVRTELVRRACLEWDVRWPKTPLRTKQVPTSGLMIVARLLRGKRQVEIAKELGVSRQRVEAVQRAAERAGIELP